MRYYLSLGSNCGDRQRNLTRAALELERNKVRIRTRSSLYETQPVDIPDQPWFLNRVLRVDAKLAPFELLGLAKAIEKKLGRRPTERKGPRRIDIDILLAEDTVISTGLLTIPHPRMHLRNFVLVPFKEIAPAEVHPVLKKTIRRLLRESRDKSVVRRI